MNTMIKLIDVFGQFENQGTGHYYTYLPGQQGAPTGWKTVMKDPRNEVSASLGYCYATWCTSTDWWIAKLVRNPHDPKGGFAMLSICLGPNRPLDGEKAIKVLDSFAQFFIIEQHWVDADAEKALINQEQDLVLASCVLRKFVEPTASINSAYRSFETKEQLGWYLSFLPQPGYESYSRIFFVPKEESEGMPVKCLDEKLPLKRIYTLKYPDDKCISSPMRTEIMDGEDLRIIYNTVGLEPVERIITGGKNTDCAFVVGTEMQIRPEKDIAGLTHNRIITIKCEDNDGRTIERFRLSNYTRQHSDIRINGNQVILPENFSELAVVEVIPTDDKYDTEKVNLGKEDTILVKLKPKDYKVVFRMGNEDFETNRTMNPSLARSKWSGFDSDVDNTKKIIYFRAHGKPAERQQIHTTVEDPPFFERFPWLKYLIIGLLMLLLGYGIYAGISAWGLHKTPWPFNGKTEVKVENVNNNDNVNQNPVQPEQEEAVINNEKETIDSTEFFVQHDIDYLKDNDVWTRDNIKSKSYQDMFDNFVNGRYAVLIAQNDSLFGENVKQNGYYKDIIRRLNILAEQGENGKLSEALAIMKNSYSDGSINIEEVQKKIKEIMNNNQSTGQQDQQSTSSHNKNKATRADRNSDNG